MAQVKIPRKRIHANCGGEIEFVLLTRQIQTKVQCKKCGETEMRDYLSEERN